jgi:hypothetical protein
MGGADRMLPAMRGEGAPKQIADFYDEPRRLWNNRRRKGGREILQALQGPT